MKDFLDFKRTHGRTADCRGCYFWSEKIARKEASSPLRALCLNRNSKYAMTYTEGRNYCEDWRSGEHGTVDGEAP